MKTRKQKVICKVLSIIVSILLLASFFVVPVAALDQMTTFKISNIMYEYGGDPNDPEQRPFSSLHVFENRPNFSLSSINGRVIDSGDSENPLYITNGYDLYMEYTFPYLNLDYSYFGVYYINQLFDDNVTRTFAPGDTLFLDASFFGCWTLTDTVLTQYRFTLREGGDPYDFSCGRVVAFTDIKSFHIDEGSEGFDYDRLAFNFTTDIKSNSLCLCFEFVIDLTDDDFEVGFESTDFKIQFGSGVSPNYPIYPPAPGGDDIGHLDSQEQQLIQDSQVGLDAGLDVMQNTGDLITDLEANLNLVAFTGALNNILNRLILIPGLSPLVNISLSLGLFASLFGLAASIISADDRRAGQAQRESKRSSHSRSKK